MSIDNRELLIEKWIKPSETGKTYYSFERWLNKHEQLHSFNGHPASIWYGKEGQILLKSWNKNGIQHRGGGRPAAIEYNENGNIIRKRWYKNGIQHRGGGRPAVIYYEDGKIKYMYWYKNGKFVKGTTY